MINTRYPHRLNLSPEIPGARSFALTQRNQNFRQQVQNVQRSQEAGRRSSERMRQMASSGGFKKYR